MKKGIHLFLLILLCGCFDDSAKMNFIPTKYAQDLKTDTLRQVYSSPISKEFIGIFWNPIKEHKVLKLYSADSISTDELQYGEHPMEIASWKDSIIILNACVYSAHGDSIYRRWYLDNSVDKNKQVGRYKLAYQKNYDCPMQ